MLEDPTLPAAREVFGGRYVVEGELGRGGMGRVLRARDLKLQRPVAVKVLPAGPHDERQLLRFEQEARAAGALSHPNIVDVHDVGEQAGEPYIVSELLEGETVADLLARGPLDSGSALDLATQFARGLAAAHAKGIVHRDLKPANLFVTRDGELKILDFGIAKLLADGGPVTETGAVQGTPQYMSPEQVRGEHADVRSDVFSFGVVAFEMVAGESPFQRATTAESGYAILHEAPPQIPSGVSPRLARVIGNCLRKEPASRYCDGRAILTDLITPPARRHRRWTRLIAALALAAASTIALRPWLKDARSAPASVAILPFTDLSPARDQEYFSDGITEEILNTLAQVEGLQVAGRISSFSFKGKNEDLRSIGEKLGVSTVLEGSVRKAGNRVRIAAQLVKVEDGFQLWSHTYDRELTDIFTVQEEIARSVVAGLRHKLTAATSHSAQERHTSNIEAYDQYLIGTQAANQYTPAGAGLARVALGRAVELDSQYGLAWSGLSMALALQSNIARTPEEQRALQQQALSAADKAVELAPGVAEGWARRALWRMQMSWDWRGTQEDLDRAFALNSRDVLTYDARARLAAVLGNLTDAVAAAKRATEIDPLNQMLWVRLCHYHLGAGQLDLARAALRKAEAIGSADPWVLRTRAVLAFVEERPEEALALIGEDSGVRGDWKLQTRAIVLHSLQREGGDEALAGLITQWAYRDAYQIAEVYAIRGDKDRAFQWLDRAYVQHDGAIVSVLPNNCSLKCDALLRSLHADLRWTALLNRLNLPLN